MRCLNLKTKKANPSIGFFGYFVTLTSIHVQRVLFEDPV